MFTGLIHHKGRLAARQGSALTVELPAELRAELREGDSVAVNGVCLTAVRLTVATFSADLLPATLADTTLGTLELGSVVNIEPALRAGQPLGGHLVQGHVDGTTQVASVPARRVQGDFTWSFDLPEWLEGWIVPKGSICIDGVSLTVQHIYEGNRLFTVELIPETLRRTNLGGLRPGQRVNLEADLIVKTVSELLRKGAFKP
jgi:riboflavin synthase alpha subunit